MTVLQHDIDLDGRIAAAIEDFAADDGTDGGHEVVILRGNRRDKPPSLA
jgi:hypothetical protein